MKHCAARFLQKHSWNVQNSYLPKALTAKTPFSPDSFKLNDLAYGVEYPNSFLDLYLHEDSARVRHPTLIVFHGGGFIGGAKEDGDSSKNAGDRAWFIRAFVTAGFNVAVPDYAYAPDFHYPVPVRQLSGAVKWLCKHAEEYDLDMEAVVFCGGSAGGHLAGQLINIQTSPDYAANMRIAPVLPAERIKAVLFNSALLDQERFDKTDSVLYNWLFRKCGLAYFDCGKLLGDTTVRQSNVIANLTRSFPPAFISDANTASFTDQAVDLAECMEALGIPHVLNVYPKSEKTLLHGFETCDDSYGWDNMQKMLTFLREQKIIGPSGSGSAGGSARTAANGMGIPKVDTEI